MDSGRYGSAPYGCPSASTRSVGQRALIGERASSGVRVLMARPGGRLPMRLCWNGASTTIIYFLYWLGLAVSAAVLGALTSRPSSTEHPLLKLFGWSMWVGLVAALLVHLAWGS